MAGMKKGMPMAPAAAPTPAAATAPMPMDAPPKGAATVAGKPVTPRISKPKPPAKVKIKGAQGFPRNAIW